MYFEFGSSHNCATLYGNLDIKKLVFKEIMLMANTNVPNDSYL